MKKGNTIAVYIRSDKSSIHQERRHIDFAKETIQKMLGKKN